MPIAHGINQQSSAYEFHTMRTLRSLSTAGQIQQERNNGDFAFPIHFTVVLNAYVDIRKECFGSAWAEAWFGENGLNEYSQNLNGVRGAMRQHRYEPIADRWESWTCVVIQE